MFLTKVWTGVKAGDIKKPKLIIAHVTNWSQSDSEESQDGVN